MPIKSFTAAKPMVWMVGLMMAIDPVGAQNAREPVPDSTADLPALAPVAGPGSADVGRISRPTAEPASDGQAEAVVAALPEQAESPAIFVNDILVDARGMTLYVFDRDSRPGASTCTRICEQLWPPFYADLDSEPVGEFGLVHRIDGSLQWSHRDRPLYYWVHDSKPGDITGDAVNDVWWIVRR
jgi:predicted lipoprotein with Yx(FWY)xxD motif